MVPAPPRALTLGEVNQLLFDPLHARPETRARAAVWAALAAAAAGAAAAAWWLTRESYYTRVPPSWQYRPGTLTAWAARALAARAKRRRRRRPIRVYCDGCFDLMHYGHANALRQAAALGDELVVGLVPDAEIERCKGPPILDERERLALVQSVKWVDEVITGVPYDLTPDFLDELIHRHRIDYVIHGDDPCLLPDGSDAYAHAKRRGRFRLVRRTQGVSTTDIVGRMLTCSRPPAPRGGGAAAAAALTREFSRAHEAAAAAGGAGGSTTASDDDEHGGEARGGERGGGSSDGGAEPPPGSPAAAGAGADSPPPSPARGGGGGRPRSASATPRGAPPDVAVSRFMPTSRRIVQFSSGVPPPVGARVVYIDGAFDVFHVGHVEILKAAKAAGDFLLVGVHADDDVAARRGRHHPIMSLHERALSVLSCRAVDEVVIGAPARVTDDVLASFGVSLVVRGTVHEAVGRRRALEGGGGGGAADGGGDGGGAGAAAGAGDPDTDAARYAAPRAAGAFRTLPSPCDMTAAALIGRIVANRAAFEERQARKARAEAAYYAGPKAAVVEV